MVGPDLAVDEGIWGVLQSRSVESSQQSMPLMIVSPGLAVGLVPVQEQGRLQGLELEM